MRRSIPGSGQKTVRPGLTTGAIGLIGTNQKPHKKKTIMTNSNDTSVSRRNSFINERLNEIAITVGRGAPITVIETYCRALNDLSEPQLVHAFNEAVKILGKTLPTINELRSHANQFAQTKEQTANESAYQRLKARYERVYANADKLGSRWISSLSEQELRDLER